MMTVYSLLSPKRQAEIRAVLDDWKQRPGVNQRQTHCKYGHPLTPENIFIHANGKTHSCRICRTRLWQEAGERAKQARRARGLQVSGDMHWTKRNKTEEELRFCSRGHERTPENTYVYAKGNRKSCRLCKLELKAAARALHAKSHVPVTHCSRGHEYTEETTYIIPTTGQRICKVCNVIRGREFRVAHPGYDGHKVKQGRKTIDTSQETLF